MPVSKRVLDWLDPFPDLFLDFLLKPFAWLIPLLGPFALLLALRGVPILLGWHPWPGFFVLILGAIVAVMPFVVDPPFGARLMLPASADASMSVIARRADIIE